MRDPKHHFLFVVGPTAVGKTDLTLEIAENWKLPVVNFDSVQVYKKVNIGSAKPNSHDMARATHHLFDYVDPPVKQTASQYLKDLCDLIDREDFSKAVFVGGSGFYLQAIEKGLYPNSATDPQLILEIQNWIDKEGYPALYAWICEKDPEFSRKISGNDHYRIKRAVEVMRSQNRTMTELKKEMSKTNYSPLPPHSSLKVGLRADKEEIRARVEMRTQLMLESGLINEVETLLSQDLGDWAPLNSVGYREVKDFLQKKQSLAELHSAVVTSTMQLIKKQMTWFRKDPSIRWFSIKEKDQIMDLIQSTWSGS